jgi:hypothetical protein
VSVNEAPPGPAGLERLDAGEWDLVLVQGRTEWPGRGPLALALLTDRPALRGRLLAALPPSLPGEAERFRRQGIRVVGLPFDVKELRAAVREAHPAG